MAKGVILEDESEKIYPCPFFPVGSIYISVVNTNPSKWFGGKWEAFGAGRTLVGVDPNDTDFKTVQKTGGEKAHILTKSEIPHLGSGVSWSGSSIASGNGWSDEWIGGQATPTPVSLLQPYVTVYFWRRTA